LNFNEFWTKLQSELKQEKEFKTLKQKKRFKACIGYNVSGKVTVFVTLENGIGRGQIRSNEFEGVWDNAKSRSRETRFVNEDKRLEPYVKKDGEMGKSMQISYITKLIDHIVENQDME